jgi:16S rRNA (guanine(527)-N(7))-methyltransferase RsmG
MKSSDGLKRLLIESDIGWESECARRFMSYLALLEKWNRSVNLTASTEWSALKPLFLEGIWASKFYPSEAVSHLDIGSGQGFPAIVLRILIPRMQLEMIESRAKRSVFLDSVIHALEMNGTRVHFERLEVFLGHIGPNKVWDCITWKGVRLNSNELLKLRLHAHAGTQFWMFHGKEPAVKDPDPLENDFQLIQNKKCPFRREWRLSIYSLR